MNIAAIDIGFLATGIAVYCGEELAEIVCVTTKPDAKRRGLRVADQDAERCGDLARGILDVLRRHDVRAVVVELPHGGARGARANRCMGMATAVIATLVASYGIACEWYTPRDTRMAAAGKPSASKDEVVAWATVLHPEAMGRARNRPEAEAWADAIATWHAAAKGNLRRMTFLKP